MARGNQRDKAREKNMKEQGSVVSWSGSGLLILQYCVDDKPVAGPTLSSYRRRRTRYDLSRHQNLQSSLLTRLSTPQQSGTEFARTKEQQAAIMRQKQEEGMSEAGRVVGEPMLSCDRSGCEEED